MAYGQKNYPKTIQGINGKYTIKQIGCFLTAFSNLTLRMAKKKRSPVFLNTAFKKKKIYVDVDDGIKDDLYWGAICKYSKNFKVKATGSSAKPPSRNAIVRIKAKNQFGTHFCLVWAIVGKTVYIRDSWDGKIKKASSYGPITGWATYTYKGK